MLSTAIHAAKEAGNIMRLNLTSSTIEKEKSSKDDLVTIIDQQCQNIIAKAIQTAFPLHDFLGEEDVEPGSDASEKAFREFESKEWLWIVDPIDGTTNFVHHRPSSVVSIALANRGMVMLGVIYDPYRDEMFSACRGQGSFLNGKAISVSSEKLFSEALIGFGIGTKESVRVPMLECVTKFASQCRGIRLQGASALELAWVACGRQTAFYELDLNSWDIAAGTLLVQEAGGNITDGIGASFALHMRHIAASNGASDVHDTLIRLIQEANAHKVRI
ncbi:unnamed protein product [Albugo candida]|nr:unnamed protein product [Albugo candida]|eukprot:CCI48442.1 unnamed protein product [Albugo candida]